MDFWPEYLTYDAYVDPGFEGTFKIAHDKDTEYTLKSRYLVNLILTGDKNTNILGNDQDNRLTGNDGDIRITGWAGNDAISGGSGKDTAVFSGKEPEYRIETTADGTTVTDKVADRDGIDTLTDINLVAFQDKQVEIQ